MYLFTKQAILDLKKERKRKKKYAIPDIIYIRLKKKSSFQQLMIIIFFLMILLKIRGSCISYASFKKEEETRLEEKLMSSIKQYEDNLCESNIHLLEQKRQELTALRNKRVEGMIVRSRAKGLYEGEKKKLKVFL